MRVRLRASRLPVGLARYALTWNFASTAGAWVVCLHGAGWYVELYRKGGR